MSEELRSRALLYLVEQRRSGSWNYASESDVAKALSSSDAEIGAELDALEQLGYTETANTHQGRRAVASPQGLLAAERLMTANKAAPARAPQGGEGGARGPQKPRRREALQFETALAVYRAEGVLGEGGAGRVYAAKALDGVPVAVKVLTTGVGSKARRFKNELMFLMRTRHAQIVPVVDHGVIRTENMSGPFYVMPRYDCSLRTLMGEGTAPGDVLALFGQLLDGVEAAHLLGVAHRDLKPENVLVRRPRELAVADFGIAAFPAEIAATEVVTDGAERLANMLYAAPEQRVRSRSGGDVAADLYALGLMLNELFTGSVPHGTGFTKIGSVVPAFGYLDGIVEDLLQQSPSARPPSVAVLKQRIQQHARSAFIQQKLSAFTKDVVPVTSVDNPLALVPPVVVDVDWEDNTLRLTLDKPVGLRHVVWVGPQIPVAG